MQILLQNGKFSTIQPGGVIKTFVCHLAMLGFASTTLLLVVKPNKTATA